MGLCEIISTIHGDSIIRPFWPFIFVIISLITIDRSYWSRIEGNMFLAPFYLFDFKNHKTTATLMILSSFIFFISGYIEANCGSRS